MKKLILITLATLFLLLSCTQKPAKVQEVSTYYLIRHAEKGVSNNPDLTEAGYERAENWAKYFKDIKLDAVYSTNTNRTIQTATPTAKAKNLELQLYKPDVDIRDFKAQTKGKTVLIVGHSNTIPFMANDLLGQDKYEEISLDNFSNLYMVTGNKKSTLTVVPSGNNVPTN